jgi:RNA polymerase sigma factor (sigma-70 family)
MEAVQDPPVERPADVAEGHLVTTDFVDCYQTHYHRLVRALRLSGADPATAQDVAQEAFARALARWRSVSRGTNPPGYVYTTGFRLLRRAQRRRTVVTVTAPVSSASSAGWRPWPELPARSSMGGADPTGRAALTAVAVEVTLAGMPPRRRACAVMCLVLGLSVADAARALGIADGTVRKHLDEARRDLQAACEPPG